jgi:hypothetical protein
VHRLPLALLQVPADATAKRAAAAVDRTTKWLDRCLQLHQQQLAQQQAGHDGGSAANGDAAASSSSSSSSSLLFAPVVGAGSEAQRARSAQAAAERDVAGGEAVVAAQHGSIDACLLLARMHTCQDDRVCALLSPARCSAENTPRLFAAQALRCAGWAWASAPPSGLRSWRPRCSTCRPTSRAQRWGW